MRAELRRRLEGIASSIVDGATSPLDGAETAWRLAVADAGNANQSVRAWFSRTAEQEALAAARGSLRELLQVGREGCALAAFEPVESEEDRLERRRGLMERSLGAARACVRPGDP